MAFACDPGLPICSSPRSATWSEPIMSAFGNALATAYAFCADNLSEVCFADSLGSGDSSISGAAVAKLSPRRVNNSLR